MENNNNEIAISIIKGEKLFNKNTPFIINLSTPQPDENDKKSNADLICVIDISGSMFGEKINQVKESLKILVNLMDEKDRLCLILFNEDADLYYNLQNLTKENKLILIKKINEINADGGTNILSGLQKAVDIIKNSNSNSKNVSSILLLSDGRDNNLDEIGLVDGLKNLTKGLGLSFTLNTFGYGDDHDARIMNKLANLRDGSFFYVDNYSKISEYFVTILGGCVSVIAKHVNLKLKIVNNNCKIAKVFGEDKLFSHQSSFNYFNTTMLQFICGKEYTFVLEVSIDGSKVKINDEILSVEISYEDITQNNKSIKKQQKYLYQLTDANYIKANEEYIRVYVYYILEEAMKFKERNENQKGKKLLEDLQYWLMKNYRTKSKEYLKDIETAKGLFSENEFVRLRSNNFTCCTIQEKTLKRIGKTMNNCNSIQLNYLRSIHPNTANKGIDFNGIFMNKFEPKLDFNFKNSNIFINQNQNKKYKEPKDKIKNFMNRAKSSNRVKLPKGNIEFNKNVFSNLAKLSNGNILFKKTAFSNRKSFNGYKKPLISKKNH